ncbi:MAG: prolipoprotein diacylglyceryl transferase, partial [Aquabacterium sp.]
LAFVLFLGLGRLRARREPFAGRGWQAKDVEDVLFFGVLGVVLGGRLGYVLFYKPAHFLHHPLEVFAVWQGGMSFHGGLMGVILAMALFGRLRGRHFFDVADLVAPCVPVGLAVGRLGNFINGELWGREAPASLPWAMVFPQSGTDIPRHPSQIYQFLLEGLLLFTLLWLYSRKPRRLGMVSGWFLVGYGVMRFTAEYFREPDAFLGLLALNLSMGQWLCVPMVLAGLGIIGWARRQPQPAAAA